MAYWYAVFCNRNDLLHFRFRLWKSSGFGSRKFKAQFFNNKKSCLLEAAWFSRKWASNFFLHLFCVSFYVGSGSKPCSGTGNGMPYGSGPVPLTQKVALPVPQNTAGTVCYVRLFVLIFNAVGGVLFHFREGVCFFIFR